MKIDIQCFVENNLNMKDYFVRRNILNTLKRFDSQAISVWASSDIGSTTQFQPGGTSIIVFSKVSPRVLEKGIDEMGAPCC